MLFARTIVLRDEAVIDCLIKWVQLAPAVDHSPVLNCPGLRAWTQLTYLLSSSTSAVVSLRFAMSRVFYFPQCPKRQGGVNNFRVTLVYVIHGWLIGVGRARCTSSGPAIGVRATRFLDFNENDELRVRGDRFKQFPILKACWWWWWRWRAPTRSPVSTISRCDFSLFFRHPITSNRFFVQ